MYRVSRGKCIFLKKFNGEVVNLSENIEKVFDYIEQKELQNLLKAVKGGQILKPVDRKRIEELQAKLKGSEQAPEWYICPLKEVVWFFNLNRTTFIERTKADDFPEDARLQYNKYDLKKIYDWMQGHFGNVETETTLAAERLRKLKAQADNEEIERDKALGTLISRDQVKQDLSFILTGLKQRLLAWSKTLPPHLIDKDEKELGLIIRKETRAILQDLSQGIKSLVPKRKGKKTRKNRKQNRKDRKV